MDLLPHPKTFWIGAASLLIGTSIAFGYVFQDWSQVGTLPYYGIAFRTFSLLLVVFGTLLMFSMRHRLSLRKEPESLITMLFVLGALTWIMGAAGLVFPLDYQPLVQQDVMTFFATTFAMLGVLMMSLGITGGQKTVH